jgi:phospholipase C
MSGAGANSTRGIRWGVAALLSAISASVVLASFVVPAPPTGPCQTTSPPETTSPIQHLFVLVQENHAFENYFGDFPGVIGGPPNGSFRVSFHSNQTVSPFPLTGYTTPDFEHDRGAELVEWDQGANDLFVAQANAAGYPDPQDTVGYYTSAQLAGYYALAGYYGLGDRFFTGVLGPTAPNRVFDITGYSVDGWYTDSPPPANLTSEPTILGQLAGSRIPWAYDYAGGPGDPENLAPTYFPAIEGDRCAMASIVPASDLATQLSSSDAPSVVYVDSSNSQTLSEHPPQNISVGEDWTISNIDSILESPIGGSSLILLFYDEAGGFWDPISPPMTSTGLDGFRVPFLVISPWTPAHTICSVELDPASVLHFIDENWGLPYLNSRVANASGLGCFFSFNSPPRAPLILPSTG